MATTGTTSTKGQSAVSVRFSKMGKWTDKAYTFKSEILYPPGTLVIVNVNDSWQIAQVAAAYETYNFKPGIKYTKVYGEFTPPK